MVGLGGELEARGMDLLAALAKNGRHGVLSQPQHLEPRHPAAQLVRHRDVAPRVPEADRRRDEQGTPWTRGHPSPRASPAPGAAVTLHEIAYQEVHAHGLSSVRPVPAALESHELAVGELGNSLPPLKRHEPVVGAVDHEQRPAADGLAELPRDLLGGRGK